MKFKKISLLLLALLICLFSACSNKEINDSKSDAEVELDAEVEKEVAKEVEDENIIHIVDCAGREVEVEGQAKKIVDLTYLDGVRILIELGAQDTLVGMSDMDHDLFEVEDEAKFRNNYRIVNQVAPELKNVKNVGSHKEPNAQLIMSLEPDVIFMQRGSSDLADTLQKQINIPVVCIGGNGSLNSDVFKIAGEIVGKEERANELITYSQEKIKLVTDITDKINDEDKARVFFWMRPYIGDPRTQGDYRALEFAGGKNVASNLIVEPHEGFKISKEQIAAWNPEIIFKHTFNNSWKKDIDAKGWHTIESILNEPSIQGVEAIKNKKVYPTKGPMRGLDYATQLTEVFYMAKVLYPEKLKDINVEKEGNEILEKFYNKDGLYTDMMNFLNLCRVD